MKDENKTQEELLKEVKKLRQEVEKDNKEKKQSRTSSDLMFAGIGILIFVVVMWWLFRGYSL